MKHERGIAGCGFRRRFKRSHVHTVARYLSSIEKAVGWGYSYRDLIGRLRNIDKIVYVWIEMRHYLG